MKVNSRKVAVIGCGFVGSSSAFALMQSGLFSEMVLIDADTKRAEGEAMDISTAYHLQDLCRYMLVIMMILLMPQLLL